MRRVHRSHCLALTFLLFLGCASISLGQEKTISVGGRMLPAPIYPVDGNVDQEFPDQFVFFDHQTLDIVLAYRTASDAPRRVHRIKRPSRFVPEVVSTVAKKPLGDYRYRYRVTNGPTSRQSLHKWFLSVPSPEASSPNRRTSQKQVQAGAWKQDFYGMRPGQWSVRFHSRPGAPLSPSQSADFVIDNENRPGIVKAYFHGDVSSVHSLPEDLPPEARKQLERVKRLQGWNSSVRWTIGPKYDKRTSSREIATDFYVKVSGLSGPFVGAGAGLPRSGGARVVTLGHQHVLDGNSPFVRTVLARLDAFIKRPRPWFEDEDFPREVYESLAYNEPFRPIGQSPDPRSSFEQQLDLALKLSLVRP